MIGDVEELEVIIAHKERATLRVGDLFLKIDADRDRSEREADVIELVPVSTPEILWRKPHVLALAPLGGAPLDRLGEPSISTPAAWEATGAAVRLLHDAPLPPWAGANVDELAANLASECEWLVKNEVVPRAVVARNRQVAEAALRPWAPVFMHGDLQVAHVFIDNDQLTGIIDWSEARPGDALYDLAILTLGHAERLDDLLAGYGRDVDREIVSAWWSYRSLHAIRWLIEHGFDPSPEIALLAARQ